MALADPNEHPLICKVLKSNNVREISFRPVKSLHGK